MRIVRPVTNSPYSFKKSVLYKFFWVLKWNVRKFGQASKIRTRLTQVNMEKMPPPLVVFFSHLCGPRARFTWGGSKKLILLNMRVPKLYMAPEVLLKSIKKKNSGKLVFFFFIIIIYLFFFLFILRCPNCARHQLPLCHNGQSTSDFKFILFWSILKVLTLLVYLIDFEWLNEEVLRIRPVIFWLHFSLTPYWSSTSSKSTLIAINKMWGEEMSKEVQTKLELQFTTSQCPEDQWQNWCICLHGIWLFSGSFQGHLFFPGFTANFQVRPGNSGSLGRYELFIVQKWQTTLWKG